MRCLWDLGQVGFKVDDGKRCHVASGSGLRRDGPWIRMVMRGWLRWSRRTPTSDFLSKRPTTPSTAEIVRHGDGVMLNVTVATWKALAFPGLWEKSGTPPKFAGA